MAEALAANLDAWVALAPTWGLVLVFVFMAVESSFIPFPSEVVMLPAGFLVARGEMNSSLWIVSVVGILGSLVGAFVNYYLAVFLGKPFLERYGRYFFIKPEALARSCALFNRYGAITTFVCRLIPVVRQLISIPAGIARMPLLPFTVFTAFGAGIWTVLLAIIGYGLGRSAEQFTYLELIKRGEDLVAGYLPWIVLFALVAIVGLICGRHLLKSKSVNCKDGGSAKTL